MTGHTSEPLFPLSLPEVDNIYELVVSAALRARQLNRFPHLRETEGEENIVEQALREAVGGKISYEMDEAEVGEADEESGEE